MSIADAFGQGLELFFLAIAMSLVLLATLAPDPDVRRRAQGLLLTIFRRRS